MCEKCGKNVATTYIKTVVNGEAAEMNLCAACAAESYKSIANNTMHNGIVNMLSGLFGEASGAVEGDAGGRCPCCGASFAEISQSGKAGCAQCYTVFRDRLMPSIKRMHGKTKHVGKVPSNAPAELRNAARLSELKEQLSDAVRSEEFEKAARLRDMIKELENGEASK